MAGSGIRGETVNEILWLEQTTEPTEEGMTKYVNGKFSFVDSNGDFNPRDLYPVDQGGVEKWIYARTTGSDTTGDGSIGNPYRTIARSLENIPYVIYGERYIIDCTNLGQELSTEPLQIPPIYSSDANYYDSSPSVPGFIFRAPLTIQATPTLIDTITAVQLTGQTSETTTNLKTLQTTKNYTLNQHKKKYIRDANNRIAEIASNTAGPNSDIEVCEQTTLVAPIEILEPSAEIRNSDSGGGNACEIRNLSCNVQFNGIKFSTANTSTWRYGLFLDNHCGRFELNGCQVDGFFSSLGTVQPSFSGTCFEKRLMSTGGACNLFSCFIDTAAIAFRNAGISTDINFWFENIFDGCSSIGGSTGIENANTMNISMDRTIVRNGTGDGIFCATGSLMMIRRSLLKDNTGDGIEIVGKARLDNCQGTGNGGIGARLINGGLAIRANASAVTGTGGDYKVGGNAVGTWGTFTGNETDIGATNPQLCRMGT